ncbi:MAG: ion transporter [Clostridia bacterium]|nr:ion transporter [Clostridia bacterium]
MKKREQWESWRARLAKIVEVGASDDFASRGYDFFITAIIVINLAVALAGTFSGFYQRHMVLLEAIEHVTAALFAVDYILRILSAKYIFPRPTEMRSVLRYVCSFAGVIDLLSFLPTFLPVFFPVGAVAFRIFRIIRIFRLFRINTYYDSLNAITEVLSKKRQQLASSVFIILVLMLASSLCMYSVEHEAQPEVFRNAFSGLWWSVSTLLTVGYGDIYPITTLGKILGIVITFLGVGMVAIPTGIISAGFVEQYSRMQNSERLAREKDIQFIKIRLQQKDPWVGRPVSQLELPYGLILTAIHRGHDVLVPKGDLTLEQNDTVILAAEPLPGDLHVELKQVTLLSENPWNDQYVRDLDISRQSVIVMIKRGKRVIIPNGGTRLKEGDTLLLHSKVSIPGGTVLQI